MSDRIILRVDGQTIDSVTYSRDADMTGFSRELSVNHTDDVSNDNEANWCDGATSYGSGGFGTPGSTNQCSL